MSSYFFLSHELNDETPTYGNKNKFKSKISSSTLNGGSSSSQFWQIHNHTGTHIDFPSHFIENGFTISNYSADFWVFNRIQLININADPGKLIGVSDLKDHVDYDVEIILIKTGFQKYRNENIYWQNNPGILPEVGSWLKKKYPSVRAIGFDFISLSSYQNRDIGRESHKLFLEGEKPILIIEDMKLDEIEDVIDKLYVLPIRVTLSDGAPCTVLALTIDI